MHVSVIGNPDDSVVVAMRGSLDRESATVLSTTLDQVLDRPAPRVVIDLSEVEHCDADGLSAFVTGHDRAALTGGWLRLAAPGEGLALLLGRPGFPGRVGVHPSVAEALGA